MNATLQAALSTAILFAMVGLVVAQDGEPSTCPREPLAAWIKVLKDPGDRERAHDQAYPTLGPNGPFGKIAVPALIDAMEEKDADIRSGVVATLLQYGPAVVPDLVRALKRPEALVRLGAAEALQHASPDPKTAFPALLNAMKDKAAEVRGAATLGVVTHGRRSDKTVPALAAALKDNDAAVRSAAANSLWRLCVFARFGRKAEPAIPALIVALNDKERLVRLETIATITALGALAHAAVPALIDAYEHESKNEDRVVILQAIGAIGPGAKEAVPALRKILQQSSDPELAHEAIRALGGIGPNGKAAVPDLLALLHKPTDASLVGTAIVALGNIGPDAKAAAPDLLNIAKDKSQKARFRALLALVDIGLDAKIAVPLLMEALCECKDDKVRRQQPFYMMRTLIRDLGEIGPAAKDATAALMTIARDLKQEEWIRKEAADAVLKIDPALGAKEKMEVAYFNVRLNTIPKIKLLPRATLSEENKKHIKSLIAELADITNPDFGISATLTGDAFAPLPEQERFQSGVLTDHRNKTASAFRSLVEMGPDALPFLLEALTDSTPTKLKVEHKFAVGGMYLGGEIKGNPLNPVERSVLSKKATDEDDEENGMLTHPYNLTVGDVCFVAIGQIVGRPYSAVRYQPTALIIINSPQASKELRDRVRAIWSSDDPAKQLLDSLLIDYATEGLFNGKSLDGWSEGSDRQIRAAMRLLYYFPKETAALIAERLRALDVQDYEQEAYITREVKNGVRTIDFIKAASSSDDPAIRDALAGIAQRTDDKQIKQVLSAARK